MRDAVDIVDIAADMTRLTKKGRRHQGLCPFHKEKTPSFSVDPEQGLFYCFGCGAGGDAIKLYQEQSGDDFPAAIEALARRYGIPLPVVAKGGGRGGRGAGPSRDLVGALEAAQGFFVDGLSRSAPARRYLEERRIPADLVRRFGLGYAPDDWRALQRAMAGRVAADDPRSGGSRRSFGARQRPVRSLPSSTDVSHPLTVRPGRRLRRADPRRRPGEVPQHR